MTQQSEEEVLSIGANIGNCFERSRNISDMTSGVVGLISGEDIAISIDGLKSLMVKMETFQQQLIEKAQRWENEIEKVLEMSNRVADFLAEVIALSKRLRVISMTARIHSASITSTDWSFAVLSDDVRELSNFIESRATSIRSNVSSLRKDLFDTLPGVVSLSRELRKISGCMLEDTANNLFTLSEKYGTASSLAEEVADSSDAISQNIGQCVVSVQFHDITRQQFERIHDELREIFMGMQNVLQHDNRLTGNDDAALYQHLNEFREVCEAKIQSLNNVAGKFVSAVREVMHNMLSISGVVNDMSDTTHSLVSKAEDSGKSFLAEINHSLLNIQRGIHSFLEHDRTFQKMSNSINAVAETAKTIAQFMHDIEEMGDHLEIISFNAMIKSAHIGDRGRPFGVIAESVQEISRNAQATTVSFLELLRTMMSFADRVSSRTETEDREQSVAIRDMVHEMNRLSGSLNSVNDRAIALLENIENEARELSHDIKKTVGSIVIHKKVSAAVDGLAGNLKDMRNDAIAVLPDASHIVKAPFRPQPEGTSEIHEHAGENIDMFGGGW